MADFVGADIDSCSIKELKAIIGEARLSTAGCFEKSELRARAREAQAKLAAAAPAAAPAAPSNVPMPDTPAVHLTFGGYPCEVTGTEGSVPTPGASKKAPPVPTASTADVLVIMLHGIGDKASNLVPLSPLFVSQCPGKRVVCVFPQAPKPLISITGPSWWTLNIAGWMMVREEDAAAAAALPF